MAKNGTTSSGKRVETSQHRKKRKVLRSKPPATRIDVLSIDSALLCVVPLMQSIELIEFLLVEISIGGPLYCCKGSAKNMCCIGFLECLTPNGKLWRGGSVVCILEEQLQKSEMWRRHTVSYGTANRIFWKSLSVVVVIFFSFSLSLSRCAVLYLDQAKKWGKGLILFPLSCRKLLLMDWLRICESHVRPWFWSTPLQICTGSSQWHSSGNDNGEERYLRTKNFAGLPSYDHVYSAN